MTFKDISGGGIACLIAMDIQRREDELKSKKERKCGQK